MRRKTTTGHAALIRVSGAERCGGAVARTRKKQQDASSASMRARKMRMTKLEILMPIRRISRNS